MKSLKLYLLLVLLSAAFFMSSCQPEQPKETKAKYVFLFIGDGMGISQVIAAEAYQSAINDNEYIPLNFRQFPDAGLSTTYAADRFITGSAAAGTSLSTGVKTNIGRIAMDTSGSIPLETIAEKAKKRDMRVGIISSVSIDHATPAVFYAHQPLRNMYFEIGHDLTQSNIDFFGGGGFKSPWGEVDGDSVNLISLAQENGFNYINNKSAFRALIPSEDKVLFINPELGGGEALYYAIDQTEDYITLAEITKKAINYLDNENGFFMMVEGGKIDWACHANDPGTTVNEVIDFSKAVDEALKFYELHPDETLIVVTADHETGGLGLGNADMHYDSDYMLLENQKASGENFNVVLSDWRKENHLNEKGFKMMLKLLETHFGLGNEGAPVVLSADELKDIKQAFMAYDISQEKEHKDYSKITYLCTKALTKHSGLGWTSMSHTGVAIPVYALGVNSIDFSGNIDNTDIPKIIWEAIE